MDPVDDGAVVALTAAGVTILIDMSRPGTSASGAGASGTSTSASGTSGVGLPVIVHWGLSCRRWTVTRRGR